MLNIFITFIGWLAWNVLVFRLEKDKYDDEGKEFPLSTYIAKTYDNWLSSLLFVPIILFMGYRQLGFNAFGTIEEIGWNDLFYVCAGFISEAVYYMIKKWRAKQ